MGFHAADRATPALKTPWKAIAEQRQLEIDRLNALINVPHTDDWIEAVKLEAGHQIARWGASHDAHKEPQDWFWLIGYLAGKALAAAIRGDQDKVLHHTISTGAVLLNWWRQMKGGIAECEPLELRNAIAEALPAGPDEWIGDRVAFASRLIEHLHEGGYVVMTTRHHT